MDLQQLGALEDIRRTKASYCRYVDLKQWDSFRQLFTPDVHLTFHGVDGAVLNEFADLASFVELTANTLRGAQTIHQVHNPEIELTSSTTATAIWSMEDRIIFPDGVEGPFREMHGYGHYHEALELGGGRWLIRRLSLKRTILKFS